MATRLVQPATRYCRCLLQPYVGEANHWIVKHHAIFQGYYFFEYLGLDKNMRETYKDHPMYEQTLEFIEVRYTSF